MSGLLLNYVLVSLTSFLLGVIVGWVSAQELGHIDETGLRRIMAVVLLSAYIVSIFAEISMSGYTTPILLHTIMGGIIGYLFSQGEGFTVNIGDR